MSERLDPEAAEAVLRRAAELAATAGFGDDGGYDRDALTEAAAEVGIDRRAVERALAEHDVGMLRPDEGSRGILGPSRVVVTRTVTRPAASVEQEIRAWLRRQTLELSERDGRIEVWRPRADLLAKVRRRVDGAISKKVRLANVDAVHLSAADAGAGATVVCLEAVFDDMRRGLVTGVVAVPTTVTPVLGAAGTVLTGDVAFVLGAVPLAVALGGVGVVAGRRTLLHEREDAARVLTLLLDDL